MAEKLKITLVKSPIGAIPKQKEMCIRDRHMGAKQITIQNLEVVKVDAENNLLLVKGAVPGPKKALVTIKETVKSGK